MKRLAILAVQGLFLMAEAPRLTEAPLRAHLAFLADDALEGRGTGQKGGELAVRYLETQLQVLGLRPANGDSYRQRVDLGGATLQPGATHLAFKGPLGSVAPELGPELAVGPSLPVDRLNLDAPLVFVGHGMKSDDGLDDYKDLDARGKVLVMLVGERHDRHAPLCCQEENYRARWTYKFEEARRRGAAGVLLIHSTASAGYDWPVVRLAWTSERFHLLEDEAPAQLQGWLSEAGATKVLAGTPWTLQGLRERADRGDFRPVDLGVRLSGVVTSRVRTLVQYNVAGLVPGTDAGKRGDAVVFSAHWDHFGVGPRGEILNGAVDNATGCAAVLAMAQAAAARPAKRTLIFLFPAGEEQGLLGAQAYVRKPLWPLARTVADVNLESLNFVGPTRDINVWGALSPAMKALAERTASDMGLRLAPPKRDPAGLCFRADSHAFAQAGVFAVSPGFSLDGGFDYEGDGQAQQARAKAFLDRYHTSGDRYDPAWDLRGMVQQAQYAFNLGWSLANGSGTP